jgi:hypothetical protein
MTTDGMLRTRVFARNQAFAEKPGINHAYTRGMINKKYSIVHLPLFSFFSKKLYRDVGQNWKGANFSYLFLLLAICWIQPTLNLRDQMVESIDSNQLQIINQLPDIHIKNGQVDMDQQKPHYIKHAGKTVAIIDTTGSMNYIADDNVMALLTSDKLIVRRGATQFNTLDLAEVADFHLNKEIANEWLQTTKNAIAPLSYGLFLLLSYIFAMLAMLVVAIAGLILSMAMHGSLKFSGAVRIATAAVTPAIILITISAVAGQSIPSLAYVAVTLLYLYIGIKACSKPAEASDAPKINLAALIHEEPAHADSHAA